MYKISDAFYTHVQEGEKGNNKGYPFTIKPLNSLVNGILPATYYLLLGPSGSGKSTLMYEQFILNFVDAVYEDKMSIEDIIVVMFSLEISPVKFYAKAVSRFMFKELDYLTTVRSIANVEGKTSKKTYDLLYGEKTRKYLNILDKVVRVYTQIDPPKAFNILTTELNKVSVKSHDALDGSPVFKFKNSKLKFLAALDHVSLTDPMKGDVLKSTIDKISNKVFVKFRNSHGITPVVLQQITPSEDNMKKVVYSHKDARDSKNTYHDCDVCLSIGSPMEAEKESIQHKGKLFHVIPSETNNFLGLENRIRVIAKEKDRDGDSFQRGIVGFIGEAGMFTDLGEAHEVDYNYYKNLKANE